LIALAWLLYWLSFAHGGGPGLDYDPCAHQVGDDYIHRADYQPELNWSQEYCGTIAIGGNTLFVFDLVGPEMRHVPVSIDFLRCLVIVLSTHQCLTERLPIPGSAISPKNSFDRSALNDYES